MLNVTQLIRGRAEIGTQQLSSSCLNHHVIPLLTTRDRGEQTGSFPLFSLLSQFPKAQVEIRPLSSRGTVNL